MLDLLERELGVAACTRTELTLLLLDADDFGSVAGRLGPVRAEALLGELLRRLAGGLEPPAAAVRCGGDGLAVVLPGGGRAEAEKVFARFRAGLLDQPPAAGPVSSSAGIATARPGERPLSLFLRAERALRRAKDAGKNTASAAS